MKLKTLVIAATLAITSLAAQAHSPKVVITADRRPTLVASTLRFYLRAPSCGYSCAITATRALIRTASRARQFS